MFEIKIENTFLEKTFIDLFNQKKIPLISFSSKKNHNNLITIEISNDNYIVFSFNNLSERLKLPLSFENFFYKSFNLLSQFNIQTGPLVLSPIKQTLSLNNKKIKLGYIHTLILSNFFLDSKKSISKEKLYKLLWPRDIDLQINKLDTHLTNLKNLVYDNLNFEINFRTENGLLIFNID